MFDKDLISKLGKQYAKKREGLEDLLMALTPLINVQLGKQYSSMKEYWDNMRQDVIVKILENRKAIREQILRGDDPYQLFWNRIRKWLSRAHVTYRKYDAMNPDVDSRGSIEDLTIIEDKDNE